MLSMDLVKETDIVVLELIRGSMFCPFYRLSVIYRVDEGTEAAKILPVKIEYESGKVQ